MKLMKSEDEDGLGRKISPSIAEQAVDQLQASEKLIAGTWHIFNGSFFVNRFFQFKCYIEDQGRSFMCRRPFHKRVSRKSRKNGIMYNHNV